MVKMVNFVRNLTIRLHKNVAGQGLVEYALIMGLVVLAAVSTMTTLATTINAAFSHVTSVLSSAIGGT